MSFPHELLDFSGCLVLPPLAEGSPKGLTTLLREKKSCEPRQGLVKLIITTRLYWKTKENKLLGENRKRKFCSSHKNQGVVV